MFGAGRIMGESDRKCRHCGAPLPTDGSGDGFCCNGCRYVYELIRQEGLDHYYALRDRPVPPVGMEAFEDRDYADLEAAWLSADTSEGGIASMDMRLRGISCVGCVWLVEKLFSRYPGALRIDIDPQRGTVRILADRTAFPLVPFVSELQRFGYSLIPIDDSLAEGSKPDGDGRLGRRIGVCSFLAMNTMMAVLPSYFGMSPDDPLAPTLRLLAAVLASFSVAYGGGYFFLRAWNALKAGTLHMDLPIALGLIVAWVGSMFGWAVGRPDLFYFDFVAVFTVLMLVGRWFQEWVTGRNQNQSFRKDPSLEQVEVWNASTESSDSSLGGGAEPAMVRVGRIVSGMEYHLLSGRRVPVRSRLLSGIAEFSLDFINGESDPKVFREGEWVPSGSLLITRRKVHMQSMESWSDSLFKTLYEVGQREVARNGPIERILKLYIVSVVLIAIGGLIGWGLFQESWVTGVQVAVSVMVVSCPCAIGLAYPRLNDRVVQRLREFGVYVRTHSMWNRMEKVRDVVFDKTGTLTLEVLEWENPEIMDGWSEEDRSLLFMLVDRNLHPVGKSIRQEMLARWPQWSTRRYEELPLEEHVGLGISMQWKGQEVYLGRRAGSGLEGNPRDTVFVRGDAVLGVFRFKESVRNDARSAVERLLQSGYRVWVLSGDKKSKVEAMTRSLGLPDDHGFAEMSPDAKAAWISREGFGPALMIGDGANDALAFERARCRATPILGQGLLEGQADYYFLGRGIDGVCEVFDLTRIRRSVLLQLFGITLTYNAAAVSMALAGWMSPLVAAVLMPLSSIVTVSWASFSGRMRSRVSTQRS